MLHIAGDIDYCTEHDECPDENSRCFKQYEDCDFGKCQCLEGYYMASEHLCKLGMFSHRIDPRILGLSEIFLASNTYSIKTSTSQRTGVCL